MPRPRHLGLPAGHCGNHSAPSPGPARAAGGRHGTGPGARTPPAGRTDETGGWRRWRARSTADQAAGTGGPRRRPGRQPQRREEPPHRAGLRHRAPDPARAAAARTDRSSDRPRRPLHENPDHGGVPAPRTPHTQHPVVEDRRTEGRSRTRAGPTPATRPSRRPRPSGEEGRGAAPRWSGSHLLLEDTVLLHQVLDDVLLLAAGPSARLARSTCKGTVLQHQERLRARSWGGIRPGRVRNPQRVTLGRP